MPSTMAIGIVINESQPKTNIVYNNFPKSKPQRTHGYVFDSLTVQPSHLAMVPENTASKIGDIPNRAMAR